MARYQMFVFLGLLAMINFGGSILVVPIAYVGNAMLAFFGLFV